jgi:hypothetical protein
MEEKQMPRSLEYDIQKFILPAQVGGIDAYTLDEGPARGVRALCVNTGGGLRYRVLVDRGLDIDQAFFNHLSLTFLSHKGVTPPTRGFDRGLDWLKGFPVGLLTSCGPFNTGGPVASDDGEELGLHGPHSNTGATIECVTQSDPRAGKLDMTIIGSVKYGAFYGPCVELRRTIRSTLGSNVIAITDEFFNAGNREVPHAWLLHINLGYPLVDSGAEFCYDAAKVEPTDNEASRKHFRPGVNYKKASLPLEEHRGPDSVVAYLYPKPKNGRATVGIVNRKLGLGLAIRYSPREFPRCGNWQHWGPHEYVTALEPMNGGVEGRDVDRRKGWLDTLKAGGRKRYVYEIEVLSDKGELDALRALNG